MYYLSDTISEISGSEIYDPKSQLSVHVSLFIQLKRAYITFSEHLKWVIKCEAALQIVHYIKLYWLWSVSSNVLVYLREDTYFLKILFIYFWREGKGRRKSGRKTSMCVGGLARDPAMCPDQESN